VGAGPISSADDDHQPMPAVSCTSINARCATLGADASVATSLVIEDAGKANANAMIGKCRRQLADRLIPWSMASPNILWCRLVAACR
jgi:hypothetical protein